MYSHTALELYSEMLKVAETSVARELEKTAGPFGNMLNFGKSPVLRALGLVNKPTAQAAAIAKQKAHYAKNPGDIVADRLQRRMHKANARVPGAAGAPQGAAAPPAAAGTSPRSAALPYLVGGGLATGLGAGGYALGKSQGVDEGKTQRNLAFGAGAAAGLALPGILSGAANTARNMSLSPPSLFGGGGGY